MLMLARCGCSGDKQFHQQFRIELIDVQQYLVALYQIPICNEQSQLASLSSQSDNISSIIDRLLLARRTPYSECATSASNSDNSTSAQLMHSRRQLA
jgi:hypothetical protein